MGNVVMKCRICHKTIGRSDNMKRRMRTVHDKQEGESDMEMSGQESDSDTPVDSDDLFDAEYGDPWHDIIAEAFQQCDSKFRENVKDYVKEKRAPEEKARKRVYRNMRAMYRKTLANVLTEKVLWFNELRKDPIFKTIKRTVSDLQSEQDYEEEEAWKYGIRKRRFMLDEFLQEYEAPDLSADEEPEDEQSEQTGGVSITRVSPAQQEVNIARCMLERSLKKPKLDIPTSDGVYVIGKKVN